MKKRLLLIITATALLFLGASPWEGSAAIAPNGELPITGFFIATNAFPRNTVVDITNIETGKSTRVIVSNVLTSPGLLAVVSRQAGELIGMRAGSLSRIRIIQPADPLAHMRFTEKMDSPENDSENVINEADLVAEVYGDDTFVPREVTSQAETQPTQIVQPTQTTQPAPSAPPSRQPKQPVMPGYIVDEPEWGGSGRLQIVDVPDFLSDADDVDVSDYPPEAADKLAAVNEPEYNGANSKQKEINKDVAPKINERPPVEVAKEAPNFNPDKLLENNETPKKEIVKDVPVFITETPRSETVKEVSPWQERVEVASHSNQPEEATQTPPTRQVLVPVETSPNPPPSSVYGIDPNDIIPGIVVATPERPAASANKAAASPVSETPAPPENQTANAAPVTPIAPAAPSVPTAPAPTEVQSATAERNFSANTIERLDRGKYYVQVAALSAEHIENALRQIDRGFAPVVIKGADNIYRILIGPLNQGESAAVLARIRSIGYKDAFVRMGS